MMLPVLTGATVGACHQKQNVRNYIQNVVELGRIKEAIVATRSPVPTESLLSSRCCLAQRAVAQPRGDYGHYWGSTPYESNARDAYNLYFYSSSHYVN